MGMDSPPKGTYLALSNAVLGSALAVGYNAYVMNVPEPFIKCWIVSLGNSSIDCSNAIALNDLGELSPATTKWAAATGILSLGAAVGGPIGAISADRVGRKATMSVNAVFGFLIALLLGSCRLIGFYEVFLMARFLTGVCVGVSLAAAPVYISEIAPKEYLGAFGTCFQLGMTVGNLFGATLGLTYLAGGGRGEARIGRCKCLIFF